MNIFTPRRSPRHGVPVTHMATSSIPTGGRPSVTARNEQERDTHSHSRSHFVSEHIAVQLTPSASCPVFGCTGRTLPRGHKRLGRGGIKSDNGLIFYSLILAFSRGEKEYSFLRRRVVNHVPHSITTAIRFALMRLANLNATQRDSSGLNRRSDLGQPAQHEACLSPAFAPRGGSHPPGPSSEIA